MEGIDLSNHNAGFGAWTGVGFSWIKVTEDVSYVDPYAEGFVQAAHEHGVLWGTYHFAHPDVNTAAAEAKHYLLHASVPATLPAALDIEARDDNAGHHDPLAIMGPVALAQWAQEWCTTVAVATGANPYVYLNRSYASALAPRLARWPLWLATLDGSQPPRWAGRDVSVVQYAISGGIDRDVSLLPFPSEHDHQEDDVPGILITLDNGDVVALPSCGGRPWYVPSPTVLDVLRFVGAFGNAPGAPLNAEQSAALRVALDRTEGSTPPPWPDTGGAGTGSTPAPTRFTGTVDISAAQ